LNWQSIESGVTARLFPLFVAAIMGASLVGCEGGTMSTADEGPTSRASRMGGNNEFELAGISPPSATDIRQAQRTLAALGYDPGPIDGLMGKKTRIAIRHFQVDEEVRVDGNLTPSLLARLQRAAKRRKVVTSMAGQQQPATAIPAGSTAVAAAPLYEAGDTYVYTDGKVETVSRVGPEQVLWENAEGSTYTAYRNFILPPMSWKSKTSSGENRIDPAYGEKWPPATGQPISFLVGSRAAGSSAYAAPAWSGKWQCETGPSTRIKSVAGTFDTVAITCHRHKPSPGTWKTRTWYFAPTVGHYIRRTDTIHGTGRKVTVDLVAIQPSGKGWPPAARGGLDWAIQSALDSKQIGKTVEWRSSAVGAAFLIRVIGKVPAPKGTVCRRYLIERSASDQVRHFPAVACKRAHQDRWMIPGIDPDTIGPEQFGKPGN
jgi:peptidoglycan hydrolase-like protein with peptidoglycan-binding domain